MSDWWNDLEATHAALWQFLGRGVADRKSPARHPALATTSSDGAPSVRTVVLRAADPDAATLEMHTDLRSGKIADLRRDPRACLLIWAPKPQLQLRLSGAIHIATGPATDDRWRRVPPGSRVAYGSHPPPGTPLDAPGDVETRDAADNFAVLTLALDRIDTLCLSRDGHRRASYARVDGWQGVWRAP